MIYITVKQSPKYHQITLEELLFGNPIVEVNPNTANTRTYEVEHISDLMKEKLNYSEVKILALIKKLIDFNKETEDLRSVDRKSLYYRFPIPKSSGGIRIINAPVDELQDALRKLKEFFEVDCGILYHTSAFAYVKGRNHLQAMKRHQKNESKWFLKTDISDFFGSTTLDFVMKMISMVFPVSEIVKYDTGKAELRKALELAFLDGGLPQGTVLSPTITTIMMIPIDYKLANGLRDFNHQRYVFTRYADDFTISSRYNFKFMDVKEYIERVLAEFDAPYILKREKTRYGSSAGANWNLGLMLNKDNEITVGHKRKKQFRVILENYVMDKKNNKTWALRDIQVLEGHRNYIRSVEEASLDAIVNYVNNKFSVDVVALIKEDIKTATIQE